MNTSRLRALALQKLFRMNRTLRDYSERQWTLHPSETEITPPAYYFEDELAYITDFPKATWREVEMRRIKGGLTEHAATIAYQISNVELVKGILFKRAAKETLVRQSRGFFAPDPPMINGTSALAATYYGSVFFGHWLSDDLVRHLAGEALATPIMPNRKTYRHEPEYCELMGISQHRVDSARFEKLIMLEDFGQNAFKRQRFLELRSRLCGAVQSSHNRYVYIRRGFRDAGASLVLTNAAEVEDYLTTQGFHIVDPDQLSSSEIASAIAGARVVVSIEGSHMLHALYAMGDGATLCLIQPPYRFNNVMKEYMDCMGLRYGFTVATENAEGFAAPLDRLKRILDRLDVL